MFQKQQQQHQKQNQNQRRLAGAVWALIFAAALGQCADASPLGRSPPEVANSNARLRREVSSKKPSKGFEVECLRAHNKWRRLHQAPELVFDKKIAAFSQKRADFIADSDGAEFKHPPDLAFGENLAWHSRASKSCADLVKMWYDEVELYDFERGQFSHETGHFTQLVWRDTKRVGCAKSISSGPKGGVYLVCNYDPPGNYLGEALENVLPRVTPSPDQTTTSVATPSSSSTSTTTTSTTTTTTTTTIAPPTSRSPAELETTKRPTVSGSDKEKKKNKNKKGKKKNKKGNKIKDKDRKNKNKNKNKKKNKGRPNGNNNNKKQKVEDQTTTTTPSPKIQE